MIQSMVDFGIPKLCILCLLLLCEPKHPERWHIPSMAHWQHTLIGEATRLWNREIPTMQKWDGLDLFSGSGRVKASHSHLDRMHVTELISRVSRMN